MANTIITMAKPVSVSLRDLQAGVINFETLEEAFGPSSLGIWLSETCLNRFQFLGNLCCRTHLIWQIFRNKIYVEQLEQADAKWLVGWSCGKETLKNGRYDTLKGSYYVNLSPSYSDAATQARIIEKYPSFPEYTAPNIWPPETLLPGFKATLEDLCSLIIDVATLVARACDQYAEVKIKGYQPGYLEHVVKTSHVTKARLLHYFPATEQQLNGGELTDEDDWCATHKDHGCLTGLTSAMFVDESAHAPMLKGGEFRPLPELDCSPDLKAGLYIHSRSGQVVKVAIPQDFLAFQTGEALELITAGKFKAVPHFIRGAAGSQGGRRVARNTLAVFTQPNLWEKVDEKRDFVAFARDVIEMNH